MERRIREKEERRKLILETTKRLIIEKGVAAFSMQDIADAIELSKATLYLYFLNKEAILEELFRDATDYFVEYVEERIPENASGLECIRVLWGSYLSLYGESGDDIVLTGIWKAVDPTFIAKDPSQDSPLRKPVRPMVDLIIKALRRGVADGSLDQDIDPEHIARSSLFIATAYIDNIARLPREARDTRFIREELRSTFELLLRGVASPSADRTRLTLPSK
ncbi:MAG: TetR family transcriptional regulator, partial [Treponemataceae bacterium]